MPAAVKPKKSKEQRQAQRQSEADALRDLQRRVDEYDEDADCELFADLPLSRPTLQGLKLSKFVTMTDIQRKALPAMLKGRDMLGAARTGSGKTLAFVVPMLELLYRQNWTSLDGLGALVISPTRELALQIFEVLRKVGRAHGFSAGLVIGGKDLKGERDRMSKMNILVCTPGRLLQHLDQTVGFSADNLQMLILDEADRCLDMGFKRTIDAIVANLPPSRQTLLFSATQTKSVKDLARLSLKDPEYVAVHEKSDSATPSSLQQNYVLVDLPDKLDMLYAFTKTHLKCKAIVFFSTGKQVRFAYETFRRLHPGVPLIHLHGRQKQTARADIVARFDASKEIYLFCTDVAARGLDFSAVDWVLQTDCPEDADTYIHRVGRTARYGRSGKALLFLTPTEEGAFCARLAKKRVACTRVNVKQNKKMSIRPQLQHLCFKEPDVKYLGQKAFVSYCKSIHLQPDKDVFKLDKLPLQQYAASLGLPGAPRVRFASAAEAKARKNARLEPPSDDDDHDIDGDEQGSSDDERRNGAPKQRKTKVERMFERQNQDVLAKHRKQLIDGSGDDDDDSDSDASDDEASSDGADDSDEGPAGIRTRPADGDAGDDDFLRPKRVNHALHADASVGSDDDPDLISIIPTAAARKPLNAPDSKRAAKVALSKVATLRKTAPSSTKLVFDDDGGVRDAFAFDDERSLGGAAVMQQMRADLISDQLAGMQARDVGDKAQLKEKRREARTRALEKLRAREMAEREQDGDEEMQVVLGGASDDDDEDDGRPNEDDGGDAEEAGPQGKRKKWFQQHDDREEVARQQKRAKLLHRSGRAHRDDRFVEASEVPASLDEQEALALRLLGRS